MLFPFGIATAVGVFVVVASIGIFTSRTAIERLVTMGILPRLFIGAVPLLTAIGRGSCGSDDNFRADRTGNYHRRLVAAMARSLRIRVTAADSGDNSVLRHVS